ncbi:MAG: type II secretion system secretin GspD [Pseudomonadota bacterium]|nr:type II secretion system secretin GspD [Pseudomonadota bacterium]
MKNSLTCRLMLLVCSLTMASCATKPPEQPPQPAHAAQKVPPALAPGKPAAKTPAEPSAEGRADKPAVRMGTGVFLAEIPEGDEAITFAAGDVTLNFEGTSLREFVKVIFDDILEENYLINPNVDGVVTLHTTHAVSRESVLSILESVLEMNGAVLVPDRGIYKIVPVADAEGEVSSPMVGRQAQSPGAGYGVRIVPLEHVAAGEIEKILEPFIPTGTTLRIDATRNLLILSGPRYRLDHLLETVKVFDVDWLKGMSFGMFPLHYADAAVLVGEIEKVIGAEGQTPFEGIVRLVPIERLNAILVITHQPKHMAAVRRLIEQFDWGTEASPGRRLYVYHVKYGKAENIATVLQELFGQVQEVGQASTSEGIPELPPGVQGGGNVFRTVEQLSEPPPPVGAPGAGGGYPEPAAAAESSAATGAGGAAADGTRVAGEGQGPVTIMADQDNNAILIMASPADYRMIEASIRQLDIQPRQVLINAIISEVTLSDELDYGVGWFLSGGNFELGFNTPLPGGAEAAGEGLALAIFNNSDETRLFFDLLASKSNVKFISAPQVMVRDNQTATIRVGDQIPVTTRASQSTNDPDAPIVTEVQYRDTGTLLTVTPRINAGGQVTMEISQEVSLPGTVPAVGGGGNVPISQRTVDSTVTVHSGQTVVLGGLIRVTLTESKSGIPLLMDIPWLGELFSTNSEDIGRTELIITIKPLVVENQRDAEAVTAELRQRMKSATEYEAAAWERNTGEARPDSAD